jgi:hypothetical protein
MQVPEARILSLQTLCYGSFLRILKKRETYAILVSINWIKLRLKRCYNSVAIYVMASVYESNAEEPLLVILAGAALQCIEAATLREN